MEWYHVYLFTRLDGLNSLITLVCIGLLTGALVTGIMWGVNSDMYGCENTAKGAKKVFMRLLLTACLIALIGVSIPTQKEAAAIYLLPKLAKSDFTKEAAQIPTDAAKLMRLKLESWIADMEPTKKESK